jgi:hypothetical protein
MSRTGVPASVRRRRAKRELAPSFPLPAKPEQPSNDNIVVPPPPHQQTDGEKRYFWQSFSKALGAELREYPVIAGASGLQHPAEALAVDDKGNRLIIFSSEPNPRVAALIHGDIQATMPSVRVLVARPVIFDLGVMVRQYFGSVSKAKIDLAKLFTFLKTLEKPQSQESKAFIEKKLEDVIVPLAGAFKNVALPAFSQIVDVLQQLSLLDWDGITAAVQQDGDAPILSLVKLFEIDNMAIDRQHGICPIPLYDFKAPDWELFQQGLHIDDVRQRLIEMDIYQYFFPARDQLALGLVEKGLVHPRDIVNAASQAPGMGHPDGENEIVPPLDRLPDILDSLQQLGYIAEGEHGFELSDLGRAQRMTLKFRPREGLLAKLINRLNLTANVNVSASPKDFLPPGA